MSRFFKRLALVLFFAAFIFLSNVYSEDVPKPAGWVNDFAGVISSDYRDKITIIIQELEEKTSAEIAVVTVNSIAPYDEKSYARLLFDNWKPGKKGKDNGVLILLAVKERRWRIETGYGVERILPDGLCGEIGRNYMVPSLKAGKYGEGLYYGVVKVASVISKNAGVDMASTNSVKIDRRPEKSSEESMVFLYLFAPIFFFFWNLPWPFIIGLPFTLLFVLVFFSISPILGCLVMGGYIASLFVRYNYWHKLPPHKRYSFFGPQNYGGTFTTGGGFSGGGFGGGGFGGGFGGGGGGGGGAGGGF